ncbi:UNVERIFIED_CONTAM: hypothetical protein RMT77_000519 [Armadillidium vulgare]
MSIFKGIQFRTASAIVLSLSFTLLQVYASLSEEDCLAIEDAVYCPNVSRCLLRSDELVTSYDENEEFCEELDTLVYNDDFETIPYLILCLHDALYDPPFSFYITSSNETEKCIKVEVESHNVQDIKYLHNKCEDEENPSRIVCEITD